MHHMTQSNTFEDHTIKLIVDSNEIRKDIESLKDADISIDECVLMLPLTSININIIRHVI